MVYVDDLNARFQGMIMCHMMADSLNELHDMANQIGIKREWFQNHPHHPHYDLSKSKKNLALQNGAIAVTTIELIEIMKREENNFKEECNNG